MSKLVSGILQQWYSKIIERHLVAAKQYFTFPDQELRKIFLVQEQMRFIAANILKPEYDEDITGLGFDMVVRDTLMLYREPSQENIFNEFIQFLTAKLEDEDKIRTMREILTYPTFGHLPWIDVPIKESILEDIRKSTDMHFRIKLIRGKVCAFNDKFGKIVFDKIVDHLPARLGNLQFRENSHISIIDREAVRRLGEDAIEEFIHEVIPETFIFKVYIEKFSTSFSQDYVMFSEFLAVRIMSDFIYEILDKFNKKFEGELGRKISPCLFSTIAIMPRTLSI